MTDRGEIDEVRRRADLVQVVEQYVTLKRAGTNLKGLCPFHNEKTPSFHVNPSLGLWTCFGECHESGDVFKFLQKIENLTFAEALERLALRTGVTLTRRKSGSEEERRANQGSSDRDRLYRVNAIALKYFQDNLRQTPDALDYIQSRGVSTKSLADFKVGYAPDSWDGLAQVLQIDKITIADAELAGLIGRNDRGMLYDRMRGRVVFPILDVQERPIAFGGRLIGEAREGQPKYWNSPETPVFLKRGTLYGLWRARKAIATIQQAVIVEGYTDVIAAHQAGFENVVATLGTSLTEDHVRTLARLAPRVVLAFDADSAGLKAAFRASEIFNAHDIEVRVLELPQGEDPDSLLRAGRRELFAEAVATAAPMAEYRIRRLIRLNPADGETDSLELLKRAVPVLAEVQSVIERERYINLLAQYHPQANLGSAFAAGQIRQDVRIFIETRSGMAMSSEGDQLDPEPVVVAGRSSAEVAESHLLRALFSGDQPLAALVRDTVRVDEFVSDVAVRLVRSAFDLMDSGILPNIDSLLGDDTAATEMHAAVSALLADAEPLSHDLVIQDIVYLKNRSQGMRLTVLRNLISGGQGDEASQREFIRLSAELKGSRNERHYVPVSRISHD